MPLLPDKTVEATTFTWRTWSIPLSLGVIDQAILSGATFLLNVLLVRWLTPQEYGAFAVMFALLLLLAGPHSALLIEPLNVVGPREYLDRYLPYLSSVLTLNLFLTTLVALCVGIGLFVLQMPLGLPIWPVVAMSVATPFVLSLWLLRSCCYFLRRPGLSVVGTTVFSSSLFGMLLWTHRIAPVTASGALFLLTAASGAAALCLLVLLRLPSPIQPRTDLQAIARSHWRYGRWILGASVAHGIGFGIYVPLVGATVGLEQTAVFRALQNLLLPLDRFLNGITMVIYPALAQDAAINGSARLMNRAGKALAVLLVLTGLYGGLVVAFGPHLLAFLYRSDYYTSYAAVLPLVALSAILSAIAQWLSTTARAANLPHAILWSKVAAAIWLAIAGFWMLRAWDVPGAFLSLAGGFLTESIVLLLFLSKSEERAAI